jgi:hypothetical protein
MLRTLIIGLFCGLFMATSSFALDRSPSPEGTELYFISPKNGETVSGPVTIVFGLKGMGVAPAGVEKEHTGHHHLLINTGLPALDLPVPSDDQHKHFGAGQTETTIELPPGTHTLQLLLGNHLHVPHDPIVASEVIEITVK